MRTRVGQRGALPTISQTITPNYPQLPTLGGPFTRPAPPPNLPDLYGVEYAIGEGSATTWHLVGILYLPLGYSQWDKIQAACSILKSNPLSGDPWVRGFLWKSSAKVKFPEYANRYSAARKQCIQFGL